MENKKPLILVPPMSEPMAKLKEVLDGIAAEENIEIFTVNDSKEFGQLVGSGGQALIMMSNAKLCATLLQENRAIISKNHSKVILLTPKEIPIKTLEKFRKVGLTEAIIENTAPKTLLYKVKLQLKSIKLQVKEENNQQVVKSMLDMNAKMKEAEEEVSTSEKSLVENLNGDSAAEDKVKRKVLEDDGDEKLDYLSNLRGKKTQNEEAIETHWKSKREKTTEIEVDEDGNSKSKTNLADESDIDMFYRGKMKKNTTELEIEPEDLYKRKEVQEEESSEDLYKRNKIVAEEITEEEERKRPKMVEEEIPDYKMEKIAKEEEIISNERKKKEVEAEGEFDFDDFRQKLLDQVDEKDKEDLEPTAAEDLGGHYKGKLKQNFETEEEPEITQEAEVEEITLDEDRKKERLVEEEEIEEARKDKKAQFDEEEDDPHEGKVDEIDNFMRGDLERTEAIQTRMESRNEKSKTEFDELDDSDAKDSKKEEIELDEDENNSSLKLEEEDSSQSDFRREKLAEVEEKDDLKREKLATDENDKDFNKKESTSIEEDDTFAERSGTNKTVEADEYNERESSKKDVEDEERKERDSSGALVEKENRSATHEGRTDKISTYYKSGESKNKEQDWDIVEKKNKTELQLEKSKKVEETLESLKKSQGSETTIDYRKLKQEFDLISRGELSNDGTDVANGPGGRQKDYSSEESYQVIEMGPTSFDFAVEVLNLIYQSDSKPQAILKSIAEKLFKEENAILTTFSYKLSDKKYTETFNAYNEFNAEIDPLHKEFWDKIKGESSNLELFNSLSMPTWMCRSIPDKDTFWKDFDLPSWANQELTNKEVELLYPFFDGVDRMGYAHILFPKGVNPSHEKKIIIIIEMLRSLFLDTVQRKKNESNNSKEEVTVEETKETKNVLSIFGGLFGKKKAS